MVEQVGGFGWAAASAYGPYEHKPVPCSGCNQVCERGKKAKVLAQHVGQGMLQYWQVRCSACDSLRSPGGTIYRT